jgi:uncharacterized membrane protein
MKINTIIIGIVLSCLTGRLSAQVTFTVVPNKPFSGVSPNGIYAAGYDALSGTGGYKYHIPSATLTNIGGVEAFGVNDSGVVAGTYADPAIIVNGSPCEISGLNVNGIWQTPGVIPGITPTDPNQYSNAYDVADDGQTFCGMVWINAGHTKAFRYDPSTGYTILNDINLSARANHISSNGLVCGGWIQTSQRTPMIWIPDSERVGSAGEVFGMNHDGSIILGADYPNGIIYDTITSTTQTFPPPAGQDNLYISSISDSGVWVGWSSIFSFPGTKTAVIKFPGQPLTNLDTYLTSLGLNMSGYALSVAWGISRNGKIIAGWGSQGANLIGWVVNLDSTTSVNEIQQPGEFTITPNPASNGFRVSGFKFQAEDEIIITDAIGKMVYQNKITQATTGFNLSTLNFPNGVYFVQIKAKQKTITKRISIIH